MNPAALKSDLHLLVNGGTVIVNEDTFEERNLEKAGYSHNPLEEGEELDDKLKKVINYQGYIHNF